MDGIHEWLSGKMKVSTVVSLVFSIVQLATTVIILLVAGWKLALITCGVLSLIGVGSWLIYLPYKRKVHRDIKLVAEYWMARHG